MASLSDILFGAQPNPSLWKMPDNFPAGYDLARDLSSYLRWLLHNGALHAPTPPFQVPGTVPTMEGGIHRAQSYADSSPAGHEDVWASILRFMNPRFGGSGPATPSYPWGRDSRGFEPPSSPRLPSPIPWLPGPFPPGPGGPGNGGAPSPPGGGAHAGGSDVNWFGRWRGPNAGKSKEEVVFDMWLRGWPMGDAYRPPQHLVERELAAGRPVGPGVKGTTDAELAMKGGANHGGRPTPGEPSRAWWTPGGGAPGGGGPPTAGGPGPGAGGPGGGGPTTPPVPPPGSSPSPSPAPAPPPWYSPPSPGSGSAGGGVHPFPDNKSDLPGGSGGGGAAGGDMLALLWLLFKFGQWGWDKVSGDKGDGGAGGGSGDGGSGSGGSAE